MDCSIGPIGAVSNAGEHITRLVQLALAVLVVTTPRTLGAHGGAEEVATLSIETVTAAAMAQTETADVAGIATQTLQMAALGVAGLL